MQHYHDQNLFGKRVESPYNTQIAMYGHELMNPTIQEFLSQRALFSAIAQVGPVSGIPRAIEKERFAPFDPGLLLACDELRDYKELTSLVPSLNCCCNGV